MRLAYKLYCEGYIELKDSSGILIPIALSLSKLAEAANLLDNNVRSNVIGSKVEAPFNRDTELTFKTRFSFKATFFPEWLSSQFKKWLSGVSQNKKLKLQINKSLKGAAKHNG